MHSELDRSNEREVVDGLHGRDRQWACLHDGWSARCGQAHEWRPKPGSSAHGGGAGRYRRVYSL